MTSQTSERPGLIEARPVRHPGRWVAVAVIVVFAAMIISSFVTNEKWNFPFAFQIMQQSPVLEGLWKGTIFGTVGAMILGISLGILMAVMRLSDNPVLRGVAFVYTWFFRAIPRYVLLVLLGVGLGFLYPVFDIGVPFGQQIAGALGIDTNLTFFTINYNNISSTIWVGILGLGLSEAAYMAEIARAGILSVDRGQTEAAQALTGNETIAMVKDTSLLAAVPVIVELFYQSYQFGSRSFQIMPGIVAATLWYLIVCSILMVGQSYLERYFGRGFGPVPKKTQQKITTIEADH